MTVTLKAFECGDKQFSTQVYSLRGDIAIEKKICFSWLHRKLQFAHLGERRKQKRF